jgi:ABC-type polar amino acid transport system ATPase subunit
MRRALEIVGLGLRRGSRPILREVTFAVEPGQLVALMGLSGSGKTTILRAIAGLEPFDAGTIRVGEVALTAGEPAIGVLRPLRRQVGMVFQFHHLFEHLSAIENVCLAQVHVQGSSPAAAHTRGLGLLEGLGVKERATALPRELSGGEAQRVAIARALALDPPLLLLDEPTASLDPARRSELGETLRGLAGAGRSLLVTSHDDDFVRDFATTVVVLAEGAVAESGDPARVLTAPTHQATRALLSARRESRAPHHGA